MKIDDCSAHHIKNGPTHVCGPFRTSRGWWIEVGRVGADGFWKSGPFREGKTKREAETYRAELEAIIEKYRAQGLLNEQRAS